MIAVRDIGVAFDAPDSRHRLGDLERALDEFSSAGFRLVEINLEIKPGFFDYLPECLATTQSWLVAA